MICGAAMMLAGLSACATRETPVIADSTCIAFGRISYAIPPVQEDGTRNVDDPGNRYDTLETIGAVSDHNARYQAICGE